MIIGIVGAPWPAVAIEPALVLEPGLTLCDAGRGVLLVEVDGVVAPHFSAAHQRILEDVGITVERL